MSIVDTFREMSRITQTSPLEITPKRAQEIIETVSSNNRVVTTSDVPIILLPMSTYVVESKEEDAGHAYVYPKQPPFASHWGIVVGDPRKVGDAFLFHLMLRGEGAKRRVRLRVHNVDSESEWITGGAVKAVGETKYDIKELTRIGEEMIMAFGNYHIVFWNCQMFAKCYLHVITGDDAVFTQWTSADVSNLFLCALIVPMPIASTSKSNERRKMKDLADVGKKTIQWEALGANGSSEEQLFKASDAIIDLMKASWWDDETLKGLSRPLKDSLDKIGLIGTIRGLMMKALGFSK